MNPIPHGVIHHDNEDRRTDYLFRVSLKCVVFNEKGEVLVVKEQGRDFWDIPGGGIDHGESMKDSIAREMHEEVSLTGDFTYTIIAAEEAALLGHNFWQIRLIFAVTPANLTFAPGEEGDEVRFADPILFRNSSRAIERHIYEYAQRAKQHKTLP